MAPEEIKKQEKFLAVIQKEIKIIVLKFLHSIK